MGKKRGQGKQERHTWAYFQGKEVTDKIQFRVQGDSVVMQDADPLHSRLEVSYERDSGKPKVISTAPIGQEGLDWDFDTHVLRRYRYLCGVDTNYAEVDGKRLAVTAIYHCPDRLEMNDKAIRLEPLAVYLITEPKADLNPELVGWHIALTQHLRKPAGGGLVGMVVDSEAGRLAGINHRAESYIEEHFLPPYIELIYASSDKTETVSNQLIRYCDKAATLVLNEIRAGRMMIPPS